MRAFIKKRHFALFKDPVLAMALFVLLLFLGIKTYFLTRLTVPLLQITNHILTTNVKGVNKCWS